MPKPSVNPTHSPLCSLETEGPSLTSSKGELHTFWAYMVGLRENKKRSTNIGYNLGKTPPPEPAGGNMHVVQVLIGGKPKQPRALKPIPRSYTPISIGACSSLELQPKASPAAANDNLQTEAGSERRLWCLWTSG